jgi:hypothetical protein
MNIGIKNKAEQFHFWEYIKRIFWYSVGQKKIALQQPDLLICVMCEKIFESYGNH